MRRSSKKVDAVLDRILTGTNCEAAESLLPDGWGMLLPLWNAGHRGAAQQREPGLLAHGEQL